MTIPPGVTSADFAAALEQFKAAVGAEWVFTRAEDVGLIATPTHLPALAGRGQGEGLPTLSDSTPTSRE